MVQAPRLNAHQSGGSRVYVVRRLSDDAVVGFHALAVGSVLPDDAPLRLTHGAGRYPIPVVVLTRLGVTSASSGTELIEPC